ncbi:LysR family transcriptional regulator [Piscinibacter sp.]|uniref:LysR family transcriptional regulator n=1 Tax=Piscinibacter sp. TaxID=1903157 RepID=UPI002CB499CC|nr:LysR family transcriptional regulator [Albitalea sp.]HUG25051.1 LysR family transcriptional regulator [Albitalea sp.]
MSASDVRLPSIDGLRAFEAAARLGSFERAADELNITPSAVSKRVATLEDLLGTPLLIRSARALALTTAGKEYLAQVGGALAALAAVPLHRRAVQRSERLRVTTPPTFARQILVPHLEQFTSAHPGIELEVVLSIPYLDAAESDADLEVRNGNAGAAGMAALMHDVVLPVASPTLLAKLPPLRTPADLAHAPLLRTPLEPWTPWFRAAGLPWPEPTQGPKLVDLGLTLEAAVSGQSVALARPSLARSWIAAGVLRPLFPITAPPANQYYLLPHAGDGAPLLFAQWLRGVCEPLARDALRDTLARLSRDA